MTLPELFDRSLIGRCDAVALEFQGVTYTFGEIDARSNRLAQLLVTRGLKPGDRLCVYLANCVEMIDLYLACAKLGVIFVPINILYREREIAHIVSDAEPALMVTNGDLSREAVSFPNERPSVALRDQTPAGIIYTSGTTGASKGAVLTHNNFAANALSLLDCWRIAEADRFLLALPLFHVHALGNGLHCWLASGCRMRLLERFEHQKAAAEFLDFRPTLFFGVPSIYVRLLDIPVEQAREIGARMRLFVSGSAPLPAQVFEEFRVRFGHSILERYGMSETLMNIGNPYDGERRPGSVGLPMPGVSVRLCDAEGRAVADGETGEIYLQGSNIFAGYWRREEATRAAFLDGYFRTGDLAVRAPDGYYTLCGRKSDLIISGGFNIYPREIEEFLEEQPGVAEAAVAGAPDRVRGEVPVAYIVAKGAVDVADLEARCREKLASFKVPRSFIVVDKLPRNALGKIQKHLLDKLDVREYEPSEAVFAAYDRRAPEVARLMIAAIVKKDPRIAGDHIGSTSVPGCGGKGIIDLAVTYAPGDLEHAKAALDALGFQRQTGRDPWPETRPMRAAAISALGEVFRVHAHVIERGGQEHRELIAFRDALRADPQLRAAYEKEKERILRDGITDSLDYCNAKGAFIERTLPRLL
ncbi:MAG TPA: AMP-binding protein [Bryobacteraceae bacterium]|nr:AMP-binding protein [Bryobacteraceae bacterium]